MARRYQYAGASYLTIPSVSQGTPATVEVFALVTNTRIAAPTQVTASPLVYALGAASGDAPGGSIIAFNRPVLSASSPGPKPYSMLGPNDNDIQYVATSYTAGTQRFPVRNPRFLHVYAPPQAAPSAGTPYQYSFLYADSNGAFDLVYTSQTTPPASYGLAFTQALYRSMTTSTDFQGNVPLRGGAPASASVPAIPPIPFVPTCVQRLNDDNTNNPNIAHVERYLITQSFSQGELARAPGSTGPTRLGGEIFEIDVSTTAASANAAGIVTVNPVGGFAGAVTLSHPIGVAPLTQPTYALRTTQ